MREPASPNASNPAVLEGPELPAVSIPDRRRIDSDVRAFLREPSTPWIVFDREGRPPSMLAVGEVLPVALSSVIPDHGFFPATTIIDVVAAAGGSSASKLEPSSLAVAADLADVMDDGLGAAPIPMFRLSHRVLGAAAAGLALVSMIAVCVVALRETSHDLQPGRSYAGASPRSLGSPVPADVPPPDLDAKPVAAVVAPVTTTGTPIAAPAPAPARDESPAKSAKQRYGRLSVVGTRDVFLDGKRLLGHGARNFTVMCGTHSIAIGTRTDAHELDVPCNAELVVGK